MTLSPPLGGFLPLALPMPPVADSLLARWEGEGQARFRFANGRSAIAAILRAGAVRRLWLPAFFCPHNADALAAVTEIGFYPVDEELRADSEFIQDKAREGDAILTVCYYGRPIAPTLGALRAARRDLLWIEDRAQAMAPSGPPIGDWLVYSPRKLIGVPDGGIAVGMAGAKLPAPDAMRRSADWAAAALMRFEDRAEIENDRWHPLYRAGEDSQRIGNEPMSRLSETILAATSADAAVAARMRNYRQLNESLSAIALWSDIAPGTAPAFAPLGFPVRSKSADAIWNALRAERIFAARLWSAVPKGVRCPPAEVLAGEVFLLPCDQRYGPDDMAQIVDAMKRAMIRYRI